jgi:hypothetical protein
MDYRRPQDKRVRSEQSSNSEDEVARLARQPGPGVRKVEIMDHTREVPRRGSSIISLSRSWRRAAGRRGT